MYAQERQQAIAGLIESRGRVAVAELAQTYRVTTETVRRDLAVLDRLGLVRRVHGGAVPANALESIELGTAEREQTHAAEKDRIAAAALEFLPSTGGSVLFDAGTTTGRMAAALPPELQLTVVTNSVPIAARVCANSGVTLHLLGGRVRGITQAAVGEDALAVLRNLQVEVAFIGTNALTVGHGLSTPDPAEAAIKRAMLEHSDTVVVVTDSSKIGRDQLVSFGSVEQIDVLVTDAGLNETLRAELTDAGIEVVTA